LNVTVDPGFSVWKIVPISVNVALSDAAANTVSVPAAGAAEAAELEAAAEEVAAFELDGASGELARGELAAADEEATALVVDDAVLLLPELQLTTRVATHSPVRAATTPRKRDERGRLTGNLREFR
jgi:hypothetical protein